ncbi:Lrp/AsnC family transcriptional regulator [Herbiconiux sp. CPCC 205716]|uniref:Lrp/AsnC family transcriptional regulator n=1 Tax=Herbiconiux gentiana TaxID=2970912 RepID=A0ABT2GD57_9MICO|nr:Lrp/AsnC family transcriptional regulator [Herbiconiux gentiana]MCS5714159.1 Lrp/AsnC family transcriptional regulator [Herbiconiux gentiana]
MSEGILPATPWPDLDETDLEVIGALQRDGRASIAKLARDTGLPAARVKLRYERLVERGLLRTVALIDPAVLGRPIVAHIEIVARRGNAELADRVARVPGVAWIGIADDYERLLVQVSTSSNAELVALVNSAVQSAPEVESFSTSIVLRSWAPVFAFAAPVGAPPALDDVVWRTGLDTGRMLDDVDGVLLTHLERNARMSLTAMSAVSGLSVPATRQRLMRLMGEHVIQLRTRPDSRAQGVTAVRILMEIRGDSTHIAGELAAMPNVNYVSESTGERPLSVELLCASEAQIGEGFDRIGRIAGVRSARMVRFRTALFQTGNW